jgi:mannosyltransferase
MRKTANAHKYLVLSLTLLAFLLRVYQLQAQSYWIDEGWTIHYAGMTPAELWYTLQTTKIVPPLYFYAVLFWSQLMGSGEFALRFCSVVFGVLTVPLVFRLGKSLGDRRLGIIAAALVTISPYQIWHSQDARNYAMLTAASVLSMWAFVELWQSSRKSDSIPIWFGGRFPWKWCLLYFLGTEWALMTHYHGVIIIGIQGLFLLLTWRRHWRSYLAWGSLLLTVLLVFAVWLVFGLSLLKSYLNWIPQPTLWETYLRSATAYSVGELVPPPQAALLTLVFVAAMALGLVYAARRGWGRWSGRHMLAFMTVFIFAPNLAAWLYGEMRTPVYLERYLIPVQIGFLLAVSMGVLAVIDWLRKGAETKGRLLRFAATVISSIPLLALLLASVWVLRHHYTDPAYAKPDWRGVADTIEDFEMPDDAILLTGDGGRRVFEYYYDGDLPIYTDFDTPVPGPKEAQTTIAKIATTHQRIWYSPYGVKIDATLEDWLAKNAYPAWQRWIGRKRLALYGGAADYPETETKLERDGVSLIGLAKPAAEIAAGEILPLIFTWQIDKPLDRDFELSLRLTNDRGDIYAQSDWPPVAAGGGTSRWPVGTPVSDQRGFWLPVETPPGKYVLQCAIYDRETNQPMGKPFPVTTVEVGPARITPPLNALGLPNETSQPAGPLTLVGYILPDSIRPGEDAWMWLFWQAPTASENQLALSAQIQLILNADDETYVVRRQLSESVGPLESWQPGQVRRAVYYLPTSPNLRADKAEISVGFLPNEQAVETQHGLLTLPSITLTQRPRQFEPPPIPQPTDFAFGEPPLLRLIGYAVPAEPATPGNPLPVTLFWQAEAEMETNYTVFAQLLNADWQVIAQQDTQPMSGTAPTNTWLPGEILTDPYQISLPPDLPTGDYRLIVGLYQAETGVRLVASTGSDYVELATVTVR